MNRVATFDKSLSDIIIKVKDGETEEFGNNNVGRVFSITATEDGKSALVKIEILVETVKTLVENKELDCFTFSLLQVEKGKKLLWISLGKTETSMGTSMGTLYREWAKQDDGWGDKGEDGTHPVCASFRIPFGDLIYV
jgi:hypothetical protein